MYCKSAICSNKNTESCCSDFPYQVPRFVETPDSHISQNDWTPGIKSLDNPDARVVLIKEYVPWQALWGLNILNRTRGKTKSSTHLKTTPWKMNMDHNHGGLVPIIFLSKWVICWFQPFIFQGVTWIPTKLVRKRWLLLNRVIFCIYVKFLRCKVM